MSKLLLVLVLYSGLIAQGLAQTDPQIAHVAQGHTWSTILRAINHCDEKAQYWINFYGEDGQPRAFVIKGADERHSAVAAGMQPGEIHKYTLIDTGSELIQGFGEITANDGYSNRGQCVAFEIEYWQDHPGGEQRIATIPIRTADPLRTLRKKELIFSFVNRKGCETGIAIAGVQSFSGETVVMEARGRRGKLLDRADLGLVYHAAFPLHEKLPVVKTYAEYDGMGTVRITGADSAVALDFCNGKLEQFRLPHLGSDY